jgi:oxygen-dependent protoporphyrinogen oxidase
VSGAERSGTAATKQVVIIGGGISGLAAAFFTREQAARRGLPAQVVLLEEQARLGGLIETVYRDGFLIECGPDSFITDKPWALSLARELELEPEMVGTREENRRAYVVRGGRLVEIPPGFLLLGPARLGPLFTSPILSLFGKLRAGFDLLLPRAFAGADESVASFVTRRFGREAFERLAQPLTSAIYGVAPERLSLKATFPRFFELEQTHRSVILGLGAIARARSTSANDASGARLGLFVSFKHGMATMVEALARALGDCARLRARAVALEREGPRWRVELGAPAAPGAGQAIAADAVVIATPAYETARLLKPHAPRAAKLLEEISYGSSALVTLAYRAADIPVVLRGSGFVVPRVEGRRIAACTFSSLKFPARAPADYVLTRVFMDRGAGAEPRTLDDAEMGHAAHAELEELLAVRATPRFCHVKRHDRAMPQYVVGHLERVDAIEDEIEGLRGLRLSGAAYRGVGMPDCVHSGEVAAQGVLDDLFGREHPSGGGAAVGSRPFGGRDPGGAPARARGHPL